MSNLGLEKNDIDISKLFNYTQEVVVEGNGKTVTFYQKVVGDADVNRARVYALRESNKLRENLRNPDWEDRIGYITDLSGESKASVVEFIINLERGELTRKAFTQAKDTMKLPVAPPSGASLEKQEEYQKEIDNHFDNIAEIASPILSKLISEKTKKYSEISIEALRDTYEVVAITLLTDNLFMTSFQEMTTFLGTFADAEHITLAYASIKELQNELTSLKKLLLEEYSNLDLSSTDLKKLPGATL